MRTFLRMLVAGAMLPAAWALMPATTASGQVVVYRPVAAPVVVRYATPPIVSPTTRYYPAATTSYYAPVAAPVTVGYAPTTTYYAPAAVAAPVTVGYVSPVVVGRGIVGQPTAYVPGQPLRNTLRFLSP